jgi:short-subunit dehydrogenase
VTGVAFVTGASSGIGAALVRALRARGWHVGALARRAEILDAIAAEGAGAAAGGARVLPLAADVCDADAVAAAAVRTEQALGPIDLLIANAGIGELLDAREPGGARARRVIEVNLLGALASIDAVLPGMVARGRGRIVGVSSLAGYRGLPTSAAYSASKAALSTYLESLRVDLYTSGIRVTDVCPGFVRTPITDKNRFPMPWMVEPEDAARIILDGALAGRARIAFPWQMGLLMAFARLLPRFIYDPVMRRAARLR